MDKKNPMRIWDQVWQTDPRHTKQVSFGRKFTAIDAHRQIEAMTRIFGPVGIGWGYETVHDVIAAGRHVYAACDVTLWIEARENRFGPVRGMSPIHDYDKYDKPRYDDDAPKKALTDALTKGISHLGFNADVFFGLFDDNKYVSEQRQKHGSDPETAAKPAGSPKRPASAAASDAPF